MIVPELFWEFLDGGNAVSELSEAARNMGRDHIADEADNLLNLWVEEDDLVIDLETDLFD